MTSTYSRTHSQLLRTILIGGSLLCLAGCNDGSGDPKAQLGSNPALPDQHEYLLPPMHIARVVGWKKDETPTVAQGLKIRPSPPGLQHPRSLYTLPNGDVLVVESKAPTAATGQAAQGIRDEVDRVLGHVRRRDRR